MSTIRRLQKSKVYNRRHDLQVAMDGGADAETIAACQRRLEVEEHCLAAMMADD